MVDQSLKTRMLDKLEAYIASDVHGLRDHQIDAVLAPNPTPDNLDIVRFLRQPNQLRAEGAEVQPKQCDGGSVCMATGTGKTHTELETAVGMCQPTADDPEGQRAIIISPRISINSHISKTYTSPQGLHCSPDDIGIYDSTRSGAEQQHALRARYLITTREGFKSLHDRGLISPDPKNKNYRPLIILDESDTFLGYEIGKTLRGEEGLTEQQLKDTPFKDRPGYVQNSIVLGFTATEYGVNHHLFDDQSSIHSLAGSDLYWKHPYKNMTLIHPKLAKGWEEAEKKEQERIKSGYFTLEEAEQYTGINRQTLGVRLQTYESDGQYNAAGIAVNPGTEGSIKGSELVHRHPYSRKGVLIHPDLIDVWEKADSQEKIYVAAGYLSQQQIAEKTGYGKSTIINRGIKIEDSPDENLADPAAPLIWRHPYAGGKKVYYHPSLVERWKNGKGNGTILAKGAGTEVVGETTESDLPPNVTAELRAKEEERDKQP